MEQLIFYKGIMDGNKGDEKDVKIRETKDIIDNIKDLLSIKNDSQIADFTGRHKVTFRKYKKGKRIGKINYSELIECIERVALHHKSEIERLSFYHKSEIDKLKMKLSTELEKMKTSLDKIIK